MQVDDLEEDNDLIEIEGSDGIPDKDIELADVGTILDTTEYLKTSEEEDKGKETGDIEEDSTPEEALGSDSDEGSISDDEQKNLGKRAQKRIQQLVKRAKEAEDALETEKASRLEAEANSVSYQKQNKSREEALIHEYTERLKSQENQANIVLRKAKEEGDLDAEIEAVNSLTQIQAEKIYVQRAKSEQDRNKKQEEAASEVIEEQDMGGTRAPVRPDRDALNWRKGNLWFGGESPKHKLMTNIAATIHTDLMEEGFVPYPDDKEAIKEYYVELNTRIKDEFPEEFEEEEDPAEAKPVTRRTAVVAGGTRTSGKPSRSNKVKLTRSEISVAERFGLSPEEYAREKQRIAASK